MHSAVKGDNANRFAAQARSGLLLNRCKEAIKVEVKSFYFACFVRGKRGRPKKNERGTLVK